MREIKFRAWDDENKKYLYVGEFIIFYEEDNGFHSGMTNKNGDWKSFTIEQYTGLKDSAENEIYEGDKFKIIHTMYIVCFNEGKFYLEIEDIHNLESAKILDIVNCKDFEIIGNIHEKLEQIK